jgi:hypothetical protein
LEDGDQEIHCHGFSRINTDQKQKIYLLNPCKSVARFSGVDGHSIHAVGGIEHGLGQCGVGMNRPH